MKAWKVKSWVRIVVFYWLFMAAVFYLEFRYMESDWAGLPGFLFTLPLSAVVVIAVLGPAVAGRFGYRIPIHMNGYHFEYGFIACAFLNAFILYPIYLLWGRRKERKVYDPPPPPNNGMHPTADTTALK
jgi:hypothetical protein